MDMQVQFATVTISLAEKDMETPAGFLLKERVQLSLFAPKVEKIYAEIKSLAARSVQIINATLNRDDAGRISAQVSMLIAPENADGVFDVTEKSRQLRELAEKQTVAFAARHSRATPMGVSTPTSPCACRYKITTRSCNR